MSSSGQTPPTFHGIYRADQRGDCRVEGAAGLEGGDPERAGRPEGSPAIAPGLAVWLLFAGAIVWEATAAMRLWRAGLMSPAQEAFVPAATLAHAVAPAMWEGFILMKGAFLTFVVEGQGGHSIIPHRSLFGVFLVLLLAVHLP